MLYIADLTQNGLDTPEMIASLQQEGFTISHRGVRALASSFRFGTYLEGDTFLTNHAAALRAS